MEFLLIPNIAYLVLVAAVLLTLVAIMTPGTGIAEILAVFALLLAGYAVYHLSFNWWALIAADPERGPVLVFHQAPKARDLAGPFDRRSYPRLDLLFSGRGRLDLRRSVAGRHDHLVYSAFLWFSARKVMEISAVPPST